MRDLSPYEAATLAREAYLDARYDCRKWESYQASSDTRCVVTWQPEHQRLVVAFRGTFSLKNWFVNLKFRPREGVHRGIAAAVDYHEQTLLDYMLCVPWRELLLLGHSLGGGMANELASRIYDMGYRGLTVCTFGAVRCHSRAKAREIGTGSGRRTLRFINNNDLVGRLLGWRYKHVGRQVYFDRHGRPHKHMGFWLKLWDMIVGRLRNPIADGISDHDMDVYIRLCVGFPGTVEDFMNVQHRTFNVQRSTSKGESHGR